MASEIERRLAREAWRDFWHVLSGGSEPPEETTDSPYGHAMLPNDHHPGAGCACRECLRSYPEVAP
jgi:hypothetical protein